MNTQPNILLITTDQQRGDCLGIEGHPVLQTPNLDWLGRAGTHFRRGYSECPSCFPARRTLMSGQAPAVNGLVGMRSYDNWHPPHTLAGELSKAGYQTEMIGKLHLYPTRKRYGFDHLTLADSSFTQSWNGKTGENEYVDWVRERSDSLFAPGEAHGVDANGWVGRPHYLPEEKTHTFWCVSQAIDFLIKRDPTAPFFLNLSLIDPHPPLTPPRFYYDRYINEDLPMPVVGDWVDWLPQAQRGLKVSDTRVHLDERTMRQARAAYYGMINFVDDQIGRLLISLRRSGLLSNTFILFSSDHGEMLGDHNLYRKCYPYEGSARVPFLAQAPESWNFPSDIRTHAAVGWQDIMPTLLDAAGVEIPDSVTGHSVLPLMRGEENGWREYLHGEHAGQYRYEDGMHFLTDGHQKYIWYSQTGKEQLFDLDGDPHELHNLAADNAGEEVLGLWRNRLVKHLAGRPEGFSDGSRLIAGQPHTHFVPGAAQQ